MLLVSCLVDAIKIDKDHEQDESVTTAHAPDQQQIDEFDFYPVDQETATSDGDLQASVDKAIVTQHITNLTRSYTDTEKQDFLQGDESDGLPLGAPNLCGPYQSTLITRSNPCLQPKTHSRQADRLGSMMALAFRALSLESKSYCAFFITLAAVQRNKTIG